MARRSIAAGCCQQLDMFEREEGERSKKASAWAKKEVLAKHKMMPALWWRVHSCHMVQEVKVAFSKRSFAWAEYQAANLKKVVAQCAIW